MHVDKCVYYIVFTEYLFKNNLQSILTGRIVFIFEICTSKNCSGKLSDLFPHDLLPYFSSTLLDYEVDPHGSDLLSRILVV